MKKISNEKKESAEKAPNVTHRHRAETTGAGRLRPGKIHMPAMKLIVGSMTAEGENRFSTAVNWFLADVVRRTVAKSK